LYTGVTNDLQRRVNEHKQKHIEGFTKRYCMDRLVYFETFGEILDALTREKQLKNWARAKKEKLIESKNPRWEDLSINF
jgi:putative endonuclease